MMKNICILYTGEQEHPGCERALDAVSGTIVSAGAGKENAGVPAGIPVRKQTIGCGAWNERKAAGIRLAKSTVGCGARNERRRERHGRSGTVQ